MCVRVCLWSANPYIYNIFTGSILVISIEEQIFLSLTNYFFSAGECRSNRAMRKIQKNAGKIPGLCPRTKEIMKHEIDIYVHYYWRTQNSPEESDRRYGSDLSLDLQHGLKIMTKNKELWFENGSQTIIQIKDYGRHGYYYILGFYCIHQPSKD